MNTTLSLLFEYGASFQSHVATHLFGTRINGPSTCSLISLAANVCKLTVAIMPMKVGMGHKQKNGVSSNRIWEFWLGTTKDGLLRIFNLTDCSWYLGSRCCAQWDMY